MLRPLLLFAALLCSLVCNAQSHVETPTGVIEGPQAPGTAVPGNVSTRQAEPTLMSNDSVLRMHAAGLADDLILQTIAAQPGRYDTGPDDLIALKKAGIADTILTAMSSKQRRSLTNPMPLNQPIGPIELSPVNEIGVYYKNANGTWIRMESEVVHIKSGGFVKSTLTHGIIKEDRNGVVSGRESKLLLPRPVEFLIYTPEGTEGNEYDLLRFRLNSKDREFRTLTGGVFHSTGGAQRDEEPFDPKRIAPHTWTFTVPRTTAGGEYGILPPGTGNVTNGGKIYTFAISE